MTKKSIKIFLLVIILYITSLSLLMNVYPIEFIQVHRTTFLLLVASIAVVYFVHLAKIIKNDYTITAFTTVYLFLIVVAFITQYSIEEKSIKNLWMIMCAAVLSSVIAHAKFKQKRTEEKTNEEETKPRFLHPDYDYVVGFFQRELSFLRKNQTIIGNESLFQAEKIVIELQKTTTHYNQLPTEKQREAEPYIQLMCKTAEQLFEELRIKVDMHHSHDMKQYSILHKKSQK